MLHLNYRICLTATTIGISLVLLAGCGSASRATVSGTLKSADGTPLVGSRITARNEKTGQSATGVAGQDGQFELGQEKPGDGLPAGDYRVVIVEDLGDWDHPQRPSIARKYGKPATSGLTLSVKPGEHLVLEIKLDPP